MADDDLLIRVGLTEKQYNQTLTRMEAQAVKAAKGAERAFQKSNRTVGRSTANLNKAATSSSFALRNMSLQLSQVAQQGAATGDYFRALAIQLPDLALGLGTVGIAAGALAPILLTLGQEFLFSGNQASEFAEKLKQVDEAQQALNQGLREIRLGVTAEELILLDAIAAKRQEIAKTEQALEEARNVQQQRNQRGALKASQEELSALTDQLQTIRRLQAERESFTARTQETADAERMLGEQMLSTQRELAENERIAQLLRDGIDASVIAGMQLAGIDMASPISSAAQEAARLASNLGIAYSAAVALTNQRGGRGQDPRKFGGSALDIQTAEAGAFLANYKAPRRGGGSGGGGGANPLQTRLESLEQSLLSEDALQIAAFERQQETLQQALEQQLLTRQRYNELMEEAQRQHSDRMASIDALRYGTGVQQAGAFFGQMADAFAQGTDKMQRAAQAFAAIESLINAYRAYNQVLADPSLPFFAKIPAAASVLAAGLNAVNAIKGAGSGGSGSASIAGGQTAQAAVSRNVAIQIEGDVFGRDQVQSLINQINEAVEDGARIRLV